MKNKYWASGIIIVFVIVLLAAGILIYSRCFRRQPAGGGPAAPAPQAPAYPEVKQKETIEKGEHLDINIQYPETGAPEIDNPVNQLIDPMIAELKKNKDEFYGSPKIPGGPPDWDYSLYIRYSAFEFRPKYLSYKFDLSEYEGGAHPNNTVSTMVFNVIDKKRLNLADIFNSQSDYLKKISDISIASLKSTVKEMTDDRWMEEGAGPKEENFQNFVLTPDSIIFYFQPYQVAAYAAGTQEVEIKYADIKDILKI